MPKIAATRPQDDGNLDRALLKAAPCVFRVGGCLETMPTPFYRREALPLDLPIGGPAIILQTDSTTVVPPGVTAVADCGGNLILRLEE
jgi:N-methylhydantoinase A